MTFFSDKRIKKSLYIKVIYHAISPKFASSLDLYRKLNLPIVTDILQLIPYLT